MCDKTSWLTEKSAKKALKKLKDRGMKRAYLCDKCKKYHLTSTERWGDEH